MQDFADAIERRTTTDLVFDKLYDEIATLRLKPGAKLSEADIARRFGVSRQPVRDAFNRLEILDLLVIRPQKATTVRGFSLELIAHSRFVRLAIELEVITRACAVWDETCAKKLDKNLKEQQQVIASGQATAFHVLDYQFHKLICEQGGHPLAFETIQECKQKIDRICVLSLGREREATTLMQDHSDLADALRANDPEKATSVTRRHLARLDGVITEIHQQYAEFFD